MKARFYLYHPKGVQVDFEIDGPDAFPISVKNAIQLCLQDGWTAAAPDLAAGEQKQNVNFVVLRSKENKDRSVTPIIDLYTGRNKFAFLSIYLDDVEMRQAFEKLSGLRLANMQQYIGDNKIERGKSAQLDRLVHEVRQFEVVWMNNPKWNKAEEQAAREQNKMYTVPRRKFVRWGDTTVPPPAQQQPAGDHTDNHNDDPGHEDADDISRQVSWWQSFISDDPSISEINDNFTRLVLETGNDALKRAVYENVIKTWMELANTRWNKELKRFELNEHTPF